MAIGGNGGPGVIQLHVPFRRGEILLPAGNELEQLTAPDAHVLLPSLPPLEIFRPQRDERPTD